jgi:hypothetical protein
VVLRTSTAAAVRAAVFSVAVRAVFGKALL